MGSGQEWWWIMTPLFYYILKTRCCKEDKKHVQVKLGILLTLRELSILEIIVNY